MESHGGQASFPQIFKEAENIILQGSPLPLAYQKTIGKYIYSNTSYNLDYTGKDLFKGSPSGFGR